MAHSVSNRPALVDREDDLALAIRTIRRERKLKVVAALAALVVLLVALGVASYENLNEPVHPGPPAAKPIVQPFVPAR